MIEQFALWLSETSLSVWLNVHNSWVIPSIQSIHIAAIGIVLISVLMINLRILGLSGHDQTLREITNRFGPWMTWSMVVLIITGALMVVAEPARELLTFSFWAKMFLVAVGTLIAAIFQITLRRNERHWEKTLVNDIKVRSLAILTLLIWVCIIILGRLIAYDYLWGSWSLSPTA